MGGRRSRHIHMHCQRQRPTHVHAPVSQTLEPSNSHLTCGLSDAIFGRDGRLVKLSESVPFVGFLMAAFHQAKNDGVRILISFTSHLPKFIAYISQDRKMRALALCAYRTILLVAGLRGMVGGPIGAAIAVAVATPLAISLERRFVGFMKDPVLKKQFMDATVRRYLRSHWKMRN